jgi:hypothetical protein
LSKKKHSNKCNQYKEAVHYIQSVDYNFNYLIILILVLLQFGDINEIKKRRTSYSKIDNSILFIITLHYLTCCVQCA